MQGAWHLKTTVLPGGRVEVTDPALPSGADVDIYVSPKHPPGPRSALEVLAEAPGQRVFKTREDVEKHLSTERSAWDR